MDSCARCFSDLADLTVFCPNCALVHEPELDELIDKLVGDRYRIYRRLGHGGLSSVFAATDLKTDTVVVVKVSDPAQLVRRESSYAIDPAQSRKYWTEMLERMRREVEHLSSVDHPGIVRFLDTGMIGDDLRYVVMEFLHGETLRSTIDRRGLIDLEEALCIIRKVSETLDAIHRIGIVHRDVNPSNILLCNPEENSRTRIEDEKEADGPDVRLIDFGISKFPQPAGAPPFTRDSSLRGTVSYSSPEQCRGEEVDRRSDIYSLAVLSYELLTGQRPFEGRTPTEIALKHIQASPDEPRSINPQISQGLNRAILRGLAKNAADRPDTAGEFYSDLESGRRQFTVSLAPQVSDTPRDEVTLPPNDDAERVTSIRRRRRLAVAAAIFVVMAAGGLFLANRVLKPFVNDSAAENAQSARPASNPDGDPGDYIPGSDADELELAARSSQLKDISEPAPYKMKTAPIRPAGTTDKTEIKQQRQSVKPQQPSSKVARNPIPSPSKVRPKTSPTPTVAPRRIPPPVSRPGSSRSPGRDIAAGRPPETPPAGQGSSRSEITSVNGKSDPPREVDQPYSASPEEKDDDNATAPPMESAPSVRPRTTKAGQSPQIGPKLLQWVGTVNRVREIRIEMPGVPGTIDIPRQYRDRVAVVEPPNSSNNWKYAVLRVFGRGNVSILVRWWPVQQNQFAELK